MIVFCFVCSGDAPDLGVQHWGEVQVRHHLLHPGPHRGLATGRLGQQGKHRLQVLIQQQHANSTLCAIYQVPVPVPAPVCRIRYLPVAISVDMYWYRYARVADPQQFDSDPETTSPFDSDLDPKQNLTQFTLHFLLKTLIYFPLLFNKYLLRAQK